MVKRLNLGNINPNAIPVLENIEKNSVDTLNDFSRISFVMEDLKQHYITTDKAIEQIQNILEKYEY